MNPLMKHLHTVVLTTALGVASGDAPAANARRQMEHWERGVVAINRGQDVFVGWRLLGTDPDRIGFNVYRVSQEGEPLRLNSRPISDSTSFVDANADRAGAVRILSARCLPCARTSWGIGGKRSSRARRTTRICAFSQHFAHIFTRE